MNSFDLFTFHLQWKGVWKSLCVVMYNPTNTKNTYDVSKITKFGCHPLSGIPFVFATGNISTFYTKFSVQNTIFIKFVRLFSRKPSSTPLNVYCMVELSESPLWHICLIWQFDWVKYHMSWVRFFFSNTWVFVDKT